MLTMFRKILVFLHFVGIIYTITMKYNNYIFDLDGTLLNSIDDLAASCNYALRTNGMPVYSVKQIQGFVGNGVRKLMERTVPHGTGNPLFEQALKCFQEHYLVHNVDNTKPYPGILEMLGQLKAQHKGVAVVSNKFDQATKNLVNKYFGDLVQVAIGERRGINKKPSPDMVLEAMAQLGCIAKDTVYVGDSDVDIETAKNSSLPCLSVLWGFRDRSFLLEHGASVLLSDPMDIPKL